MPSEREIDALDHGERDVIWFTLLYNAVWGAVHLGHEAKFDSLFAYMPFYEVAAAGNQ